MWPWQVLSLRSRDDAVRAAAIEVAAELTGRERTLATAVEQPATLSALIDLWEGVTNALTGRLGRLRGWDSAFPVTWLAWLAGWPVSCAAPGLEACSETRRAQNASSECNTCPASPEPAPPHTCPSLPHFCPPRPRRRDGRGVCQRVRRLGAAAAGRRLAAGGRTPAARLVRCGALRPN